VRNGAGAGSAVLAALFAIFLSTTTTDYQRHATMRGQQLLWMFAQLSLSLRRMRFVLRERERGSSDDDMHYYRQQAVTALASAQLLTVHATFEKPESRVGLHAGVPC
jgi:hypothetical protein